MSHISHTAPTKPSTDVRRNGREAILHHVFVHYQVIEPILFWVHASPDLLCWAAFSSTITTRWLPFRPFSTKSGSTHPVTVTSHPVAGSRPFHAGATHATMAILPSNLASSKRKEQENLHRDGC